MTQQQGPNPLRQLPIPAIPGVGFVQDKYGGLLIRFHVNDTVAIRDVLVKAATLLTEMAVKSLQDQKLVEQQRFVLPPSKEQVLEQRAKEVIEGAPHPALSEPIVVEEIVFPRLPQVGALTPSVNTNPPVQPIDQGVVLAPLAPGATRVVSRSAAPVVVRSMEGVEDDDGSLGPPPPSLHLNGGAS